MKICRTGLYLLVGCFFLASLAHTQDNNNEKPKIELWLTDPGQLKYPPLARQARISGDVKIQLEVKRDGSVAQAKILSGPPMLQQAALESAQQSKFQCNGCTGETTPYEVTYTFGFREQEPPNCGYRRFRVARCLYLWNCSKERYVLRPPVIGETLDRVIILADAACAMP
jgi:TonB family protein